MFMRYKDLQKKSPDELQKELANTQKEMMKLRTQIATGAGGKEIGKVAELKRTVARIKTLQNKHAGVVEQR